MSERLQYIKEVEGLFKPLGAYSFASIDVITGKVETAGQVANDQNNNLVEGGIAEQTRKAMDNVIAILGAAATDLSNVSRVYVSLQNKADFLAMNQVYATYFEDGQTPPPRVSVEGAPPVEGALVEIYMDAVLPAGVTPTR